MPLDCVRTIVGDWSEVGGGGQSDRVVQMDGWGCQFVRQNLIDDVLCAEQFEKEPTIRYALSVERQCKAGQRKE